MVARTIKNEARKKMRHSSLSTCKGVVGEFVYQALGPDRKAFWEAEGLIALSSRYTLDSKDLLSEVMAIDPDRIVHRLKVWFDDGIDNNARGWD